MTGVYRPRGWNGLLAVCFVAVERSGDLVHLLDEESFCQGNQEGLEIAHTNVRMNARIAPDQGTVLQSVRKGPPFGLRRVGVIRRYCPPGVS